MRQAEIQVGGRYVARVSGRLVVVRVEVGVQDWSGRWTWIVRNERTGRACRFRSAQRFLKPADPELQYDAERDQFRRPRPDPGPADRPEPGRQYRLTGERSIASGCTWAQAEVRNERPT